MVLFSVADHESCVFVPTRERFDWKSLARALLASHWAVDSEAATWLTTVTFDRLKSDPGIGRAEALRQAMLGYLNDASFSKHAYPAFWGPFALIGEGAAR